ncbi:hypothetical protein [Escherichia coli]|uniref:hypothetical protein n=1 Tax=Escherichia coli TaxID=562 RepID=UPI002806D682|nr:hypothetical protein [Escherichia coli]MDQ8082300.1 hypothetical protein [Escherichia coli]
MKAIQCCYFLALVSSHLMAGVMGDDNIFLSNSDSAALYCVAKIFPDGENILIYKVNIINAREGANKQVISSQADSLIKISRIWADFFPANTSNQPI